MPQSLWILGPLPSLNDMLAAAKSGHGKGNAYARMKSEWTEIVALEAKSKRLKPIPGKVRVFCQWFEVRANRDPDNIHAGVKFILDGLVVAKVIGGDSQRYIKQIAHWVHPANKVNDGTDSPGVLVELEPYEAP